MGQGAGGKTEVTCVGQSKRGGNALRALIPFFGRGSYDAIYKNCNSFTDAAVYFLTGVRLEARLSRLERLVLATEPISLGLMNRLLQRSEDKETGSLASSRDDENSTSSTESETRSKGVFLNGYKPNPLAQDFSLDDFVAF